MAKATMGLPSKRVRQQNIKSASNRRPRNGTGRKLVNPRERKTIEQLAAEQGVKPTRLEDILGKGAHLWKSDEEFERFVADIYAQRREDRDMQ